MSKFEVGDRVRMRGTKWKGEIIEVFPGGGWVRFRRDINGISSMESREIFIRLKPARKAREFWIEHAIRGTKVWTSDPHDPSTIHVREVLNRNKS